MRATIVFIENGMVPLYVHGGALGINELGSYTNIKDYSKKDRKIIASVPTNQVLYIEFDDPEVIVTVNDINKNDNL